MSVLDKLEAAEKVATAGPWGRVNASNLPYADGTVIKNLDHFDWVASVQVSNVPEWRDNAALIVLLRNHVADLIRVARAAQYTAQAKGIKGAWLYPNLRAALALLTEDSE